VVILDKLKARFRKPNNLTKPIAELELSVRTYHCLRRAEITTVGDLVKLSWNDIARLRKATRRSCEEVEKALKGMGLGLREE
jgi:DNA-directed RNA polymerase subunit alpha